MEKERDSSSSSESDDLEEEEEEEEEEDEIVEGEYLDSESEQDSGKNDKITSDSKLLPKEKKRKRRKKKARGHRRNIKSKYETIEDLNPEALSAQTEEVERIRRLELQQSILKGETSVAEESMGIKRSESVKSKADVVMVDLTAEDDEDEEAVGGHCKDDKQFLDDAISLGDDSEGDSSSNEKKIELESKKDGALSSKYDFVSDHEDSRVLVNVNHPADDEDIFLGPQIARSIKPHQIGGVRFMFDNIIESLKRYHESVGFGCILADAMGLGKTLQVISFVDIFMRHTRAPQHQSFVDILMGHTEAPQRRVLIIVPVNTLQNWLAEFNHWLPTSGGGEGNNEIRPRNFTLFMLSETVKSMDARYEIITNWYKMGGILLMGYEMYRLLSLSVPSIGGNKMAIKKRKSKKNQADSGTAATIIDLEETEKEMDNLIEIQTALCNPGPDLIVCDEGHRIKNDATNISQALKKIKTRRRIVLTGYPLQNNLLEYWCMVDFVRPKYLGTKQEFLDLFERPISNGQCIDSTPADVRLMKFRSHVLHRLLGGFVLRRGHEILRSVLPPKFEHVILVRNSHVQRVLYDLNMLQTQEQQGSGTVPNIGPLKAFAVCSKIWNHPDIYYEQAMHQEYQSALSLLSDEGFLSGVAALPESSCKLEWPSSLHGYETGILENSPKMLIMMAILELSVAYGDRILIFSQSLPTLSFIEKILSNRLMPLPYSADIEGNYKMSDNKWLKGKNYFRLDGSTSSSERDRLVTQFNSPSNYSCWVFLLSTKAGCLGINLTGANRVIVVDVSWNPCYDSQAVCRVYRYGQTKPSYIYRLVSDGSMEKRMYDRQISKQGMADRVVDELNPERHFTASDILSLLSPLGNLPPPRDLSEHVKEYLFDSVLMQLLNTYGLWLTKLPFKHESLLIDSQQDKLTEVEKYVAMKGFHQQLTIMRKAYTQQTDPNQINQTHPILPNQSQSSQQPSPHQILEPHLQQQQVYSQETAINPQYLNVVRPQTMQQSPQLQSNLYPHSLPHSHSHTQFPMATVPCIPSQNIPGLNTNISGTISNISGPSEQLVAPNVYPFRQEQFWTSGQIESGVSHSTSTIARHQDETGNITSELDNVICIDSDSDADESHAVVSNSSLIGGTNSGYNVPFTAQHRTFTTPLSFVSSSIPVAMVTPSVVSHTTPTAQQTSQSKTHTPSEAAVANALAGFVQFQKDMCKDLSQKTDGVAGPAKLALNSFANTIQVYSQQNEPPTVTNFTDTPLATEGNFDSFNSASSQACSSSSPLSELLNSIQETGTTTKDEL